MVDVLQEGESVLHVLKEDLLEPGQEVSGRIDWDRRFDHMQQHTGQHILSQSFLRELGAETLSFHLGTEVSTIDLDRESLTPPEIYQVEETANRIVFENRRVLIHFTEAGQQHRFPLRKEPVLQGPLRIVEVEGFDWSACGGTHCRHTGEVGLIKVRRWERVRQQARVEFLCGGRALRDYRWKNRTLYRLSRLLSSSDRQLEEAAGQLLAREQQLRRQLSAAQEALLDAEAERLLRHMKQYRGQEAVRALLEEEKGAQAGELARRLTVQGSHRVVLLGVRAEKPILVLACSPDLPYDVRRWVELAAPLIGGRGGGTAHFAQAGGTRAEGLEEALDRILQSL